MDGDQIQFWQKKMIQFINTHNLHVADLWEEATGPVYTFEDSRGNQSYIDHILTWAHMRDRMLNIQVNNDHVLNTSDHLPITVCMRPNFSVNVKHCVTSVKTNLLWKQLNSTECKTLYPNQIEEIITDILLQYYNDGYIRNNDDCEIITDWDILNLVIENLVKATLFVQKQNLKNTLNHSGLNN